MNSSNWKNLAKVSLVLFSNCLFAQEPPQFSDLDKGIDHYKELASIGYTDNEIFEDLGNANFLAKKYQASIYWYSQLLAVDKNPPNYKAIYERYLFAVEKLKNPEVAEASLHANWLVDVQSDYKVDTKEEKYNSVQAQLYPSESSVVGVTNSVKEKIKTPLFAPNQPDAPILVSDDGKTIYYNQAVYLKPSKGIFSKKIKVFKIFKTTLENGNWTAMEELNLCPKYYSVKNPSLSKDGKRLFYTSNMPGGFGKYDIYASDILSSGKFGVAKNLGTKVNSKGNEFHPVVMENGMLTFASDGRQGYGGLDIYVTTVKGNKVALASNLGNPINSSKDDFAISIQNDERVCEVLTNRNTLDKIDKVTFHVDTKYDGSLSVLTSPVKFLELDKNTATELSKNLFED